MSRRRKTPPDLPSLLSSLFTVDTSERASKGITISLDRNGPPTAEPDSRPGEPSAAETVAAETGVPGESKPVAEVVATGDTTRRDSNSVRSRPGRPRTGTSSTFIQMPLPLATDRVEAAPAPAGIPARSSSAPQDVDAGGIRLVNGRVVRESRHPDSEWSTLVPAFGLVAEPAPEYRRGMGTRGYVRYSRASDGPGEPLGSLEYVVVDVETTGAPAGRGHRITEVAIVHVSADGRIVDEFSTLVNPGRSIPAMISAITNITTDMVADAPPFEAIAAAVRQRLDGRVFVAHNAGFDWHFLSTELQMATGLPLRGKLLCTVRMARKFVPEIPKRSLDALSFYFGVENDARHRAFGDARATADIFGRLMQRAEEREIRHWNELQRALYARKRKRRARGSSMPRMIDYLP